MILYHFPKFSQMISPWMKGIFIFNNIGYFVLVINSILRWHLVSDILEIKGSSLNFAMIATELIMQIFQTMTFTLVMLKFKKIELTIDPAYTTADQVLGKIKQFYIISRFIVFWLFSVVIIGVIILITFIFVNKKEDAMMNMIWTLVIFGCIFFFFCVFMAYYFASMAVRLIQILNNEGQSINIRNHMIIHIFLAVVFLSGVL